MALKLFSRVIQMSKTPNIQSIPIPLSVFKEAQARISEDIVRTPVIPLKTDEISTRIYLKLENLQPVGSFKIRAASNALKQMTEQQLENGVWTVVMGRAFEVPEDAVKLAAGIKKSVGVAAWEGAAGERGGVKAFSKE